MEQIFITIREATELTGKADITIRRLIKHLIRQNNPETTQMIRQEQAGKSFIYKINKGFLLRELKISEPEKTPKKTGEKQESGKQESGDTTKKEQTEPPDIIREVIKTLKSQIYIKDKQIDSLGNKIDNLIERDHETNVILKSLHDRVFMLEAPKKPQNENEPEVIEMTQSQQKTENEPTGAEKGKLGATEEDIEKSKQKKSGGLVSWLFGRK